MKRIRIFSLILLAFAGASCQKELSPVLGDPDERLSETLKSYKEQLIAAEYGWNGYIYTKLGGGYTFHFVFHEDGSVEMVGDLSPETVETVNESTWRLKSSQQSLLIFDTYAYLHLLADPDGDVFEGEPGQGYGSDYEFAFIEVSADTLRFRGKLNKVDFYMVRATEQDQQDWRLGRVLEVAEQIKKHRFATSARSDLKLMINPEKKTVLFQEEGSESFTSIPYTYNNRGLTLKTAFSNDVYSFNEIYWDNAQNTYFAQSEGSRMELPVSNAPLFPLSALIGYGKEFDIIEFNGEVLDPRRSAGLNQRWSQAKENNLLYMGPPVGRILLDYAVMRFLEQDEVSIHFRYKHPIEGTLFTVGIWYRLQVDPEGEMQFTYIRKDNNTLFNDERIMKPFTADFFASKTFIPDWVVYPEGPGLIAGLYTEGDPEDFFYGIPR